ncbi:ribosome silencing factor [Thermocrinis sp.]
MDLLKKIVNLLEEKKAEDIVVLDVSELTNISDYFIIATANSAVHARALAEHITETLEKEGIRPIHVEGLENAYWILIDFVDIIIHIFQREWREYYDIEWLYSTAKRMEV